MPTLQSSGQISIGDINVEAGNSETTANSSLTALAEGAQGLQEEQRPNMTVGTPHAMSEFYGINASGNGGE